MSCKQEARTARIPSVANMRWLADSFCATVDVGSHTQKCVRLPTLMVAPFHNDEVIREVAQVEVFRKLYLLFLSTVLPPALLWVYIFPLITTSSGRSAL